jgi:hypothetical protein
LQSTLQDVKASLRGTRLPRIGGAATPRAAQCFSGSSLPVTACLARVGGRLGRSLPYCFWTPVPFISWTRLVNPPQPRMGSAGTRLLPAAPGSRQAPQGSASHLHAQPPPNSSVSCHPPGREKGRWEDWLWTPTLGAL